MPQESTIFMGEWIHRSCKHREQLYKKEKNFQIEENVLIYNILGFFYHHSCQIHFLMLFMEEDSALRLLLKEARPSKLSFDLSILHSFTSWKTRL